MPGRRPRASPRRSPRDTPAAPEPPPASALAPSVRGFKIAENQSPQPQDRVFFSFNYFNNLNAAINRGSTAPINNLRAYREIFGFEKTFDDGRGSFGIRLPIDTLFAGSTISGNFAKPGRDQHLAGRPDALHQVRPGVRPEDRQPDLGGPGRHPADRPEPVRRGQVHPGAIHTTTIQPFVGYIFAPRPVLPPRLLGASTFPVDSADVTLVYNDVGVGYFVYRDPTTRGRSSPRSCRRSRSTSTRR